MTDTKKLLDRQLSCVTWTQSDRNAVRCAIRKEHEYPMKKKAMMILTAALLLIMMTGVALAVSMRWGVMDFAQRDARVYETLPDAPLQTAIPQQGGQGAEARISVTDAIWDGETVYITLLAEPVQPGVLLMDWCLAPDMPAGNLDRELPDGKTIAEWAADNGFTDMLGLDISPSLNGDWPASAASWHMEEDGAFTMLIVFEGVEVEHELNVVFHCTTYGYDEEENSFSDLSRADGIQLSCTLSAPNAE